MDKSSENIIYSRRCIEIRDFIDASIRKIRRGKKKNIIHRGKYIIKFETSKNFVNFH